MEPVDVLWLYCRAILVGAVAGGGGRWRAVAGGTGGAAHARCLGDVFCAFGESG